MGLCSISWIFIHVAWAAKLKLRIPTTALCNERAGGEPLLTVMLFLTFYLITIYIIACNACC
jgi:hypothetical protein